MKKTVKEIALGAGVFAFWIAVWAVVAAAVGQELLVPSPLVTGKTLVSLAGDGEFWLSVLFSLLRVAEGFLFGVLAGTVLAVCGFVCPPAGRFVKPILTVIKATPVASFIVLALVWIQTDNVPVFISFLMVTPFVWANVKQGLQSAPQELKEVCELYRFGRRKTVRVLYLPAVKPYFFAALDTSIGLAWKAGIAAEVLCRPDRSIGNAIWRAKLTLETPAVFAWTAVVVVLSLILEKLLHALLKKGREAAK